MQAQHQSSGDMKATTPTRRLMATAIIGAAMICYLVHKTPDARIRLEALANTAHGQGDLDSRDYAVVARLLALPTVTQQISRQPPNTSGNQH